ncbi:MAG: hypothetical protein H0V64_02930 [Geodermatophilaceae bacterium]|nr:hypothetical protein [Geodermatophilaceae bacterium]
MPPAAVPFAELSRLGAFFALRPAQDEPGWTGVRRLLEDTTVTDEAIDLYAERLATGRRDIAGSLLVQGWAGRLTSVFAGCAEIAHGSPDLAAANLTYRFVEGAPAELSVFDPTLRDAALGWRRLVDYNLEPLIAAVDGQCRAGRRRLWGNVAAALAGSLGGLARAGVAGLPELTGRLWARPAELADLGEWVSTASGPLYSRRTCCNIVRIPGYSLCADCVIDR